MYVNPIWVEENREEVEREAFRLYQLRQRMAQENNPHDEWITACSHVYMRSLYRQGVNERGDPL